MKIVVLFLLLSLTASTVYGQAHIIKQRARELSDQNNARQGVTPSAPTARPPVTVPPPAAPPQPMIASPEVLRQHDINVLKADISGVKPGVAPGVEQFDQLSRNVTTAVRGNAKPSTKILSQLSQNLGAALVQARLTEANQVQLADDLVSVLNCGGMSAPDLQARITSVQATLQRGGVERKIAVAVANNLKQVATEIQKPAAK